MKKLNFYILLSQKIVLLHFFHQLLEIDTWNTYGILFSVEQMTFFCRAVEIPKKSVEQSRFEQLHFEQLTLTPLNVLFQADIHFICISLCTELKFKITHEVD